VLLASALATVAGVLVSSLGWEPFGTLALGTPAVIATYLVALHLLMRGHGLDVVIPARSLGRKVRRRFA